jgi:hypothetical protein
VERRPWRGRYVLFQGNRYYEMKDEELEQLLGKEGFDSLRKPLAYRFPVGLVSVLVFIVAVVVCSYFSKQSRARRQLSDYRYHQAAEVYINSLPSESGASAEDKKKALASGVDYLVQNHGIPFEHAETKLRLILAEKNREYSYILRQHALAYEQDEEWELAIEYYQQASDSRSFWDQPDQEFLLKCVQRVREKQERSCNT